MGLRTSSVSLLSLRALAGAALVACTAGGVAFAQTPPQPDFFWPYGTIQQSGANLVPEEQSLLAFVRGAACGATRTLVGTAGPGTPAGDVGKTVYAIDVLADGPGSGQREGCGRDGDPVLFYLPEISRVSEQKPAFHQGDERVNLTMDVVLGVRLVLPVVSDDGPLQ